MCPFFWQLWLLEAGSSARTDEFYDALAGVFHGVLVGVGLAGEGPEVLETKQQKLKHHRS
jgi:hypothetical protein